MSMLVHKSYCLDPMAIEINTYLPIYTCSLDTQRTYSLSAGSMPLVNIYAMMCQLWTFVTLRIAAMGAK